MSYKRTNDYRRIYNRIQQRLYRLKQREQNGYELTHLEKELLTHSPTKLAEKEYKQLVEQQQKKAKMIELKKQKYSLKYDRWINSASKPKGTLIQIGDEFIPVPVKNKKKKQLWESLV